MIKNKVIIILSIMFILFSFISISYATNNMEILEKRKVVDILDIKQFDETIQKQITEGEKEYKLINIDKQENFKTVSKNKIVEEELIVATNDKYEILKRFDDTKDIEEDGYNGTLNLDINSLDINIRDSYTEEYKVYLQKTYTNVDSNELNSIEKTIVQDNITYYLINPEWEISEVQDINGGNIPIKYNGTMYYEGIKTRTVIKDYLAKINYTGEIQKEELESITYILHYEEIEKEIQIEKKTDYTVPIIASGSIIFFSGFVIWKRKKNKKTGGKK